jgi:uncharacterized protein (TIGR03000 family)
MYSVVLLAALGTGQGSANGHLLATHYNYGACYGPCYGVGYYGWGGWGLPYGGYGWPCYHGHGAGVPGVPMSPLLGPTLPGTSATEGGADRTDDGSKKKDKDSKDGDTMARARITVFLPEGARLYVDGKPVESTAGANVFRTPPLASGNRYFYEVTAVRIQDGKPISETRQILLGAGAKVRTDFREAATATASR